MNILDGKKVSEEIIENICKEIKEKNLKLGFAIIWIGNDEASRIYVNNKIKKCEMVGINVELHHLDSTVSESDVLNLIDELNNREDINGILLQSPIPNHIDIKKCFNRINYKKDIDGFSNISMGNLMQGNYKNVACTPKGIIRLLDYYNIPLKGKNVCIINRSNIVGKPLFHLLLEKDATVTMCHSKTRDLKSHTINADIIVSAVGKPKFITEDMVKDGVIIIDVGITRLNGKVVGDVDFDNVKEKALFITPVPGGVGPMTIAMVLENIIDTIR